MIYDRAKRVVALDSRRHDRADITPEPTKVAYLLDRVRLLEAQVGELSDKAGDARLQREALSAQLMDNVRGSGAADAYRRTVELAKNVETMLDARAAREERDANSMRLRVERDEYGRIKSMAARSGDKHWHLQVERDGRGKISGIDAVRTL